MEPGQERTDRTPRWVLVFGVIALVVLLLFVVVLLVGGGEHGPGRHSGPPPGVTHEQPSP
jgi:hypothetical protein